MKFSVILAICGRISSGKTHVANLIGSEYKIPILSFGDYLRHVCTVENRPIDRDILQSLGQELISKNSNQFVQDVIRFSGHKSGGIVIEGVRHNSVLEELQLRTDNLITIFVEEDLGTRHLRYTANSRNRGKALTLHQFKSIDSHLVEQDIDSIKLGCDIVVNTSGDYGRSLFVFLERKIKEQ